MPEGSGSLWCSSPVPRFAQECLDLLGGAWAGLRASWPTSTRLSRSLPCASWPWTTEPKSRLRIPKELAFPAELRQGVERDTATRAQADRALARLLDYLPALPFGEAQAHRYGLLAAAVKDRRRDALDRLITAHALSLDLTLVTNNEADFAGYPGLRVENWLTGP